MRRAALAALAALVLSAATAAAAERGLAFVYVSPNVGLASGGHAALRADDTVYHLQNAESGLLLLVREGWSSFHLVYAELENRPLEIAHVDVAPEVTERLQRTFAQLYVEQELELGRRAALRDDVDWLEAFVAGVDPPAARSRSGRGPSRSTPTWRGCARPSRRAARAPGSASGRRRPSDRGELERGPRPRGSPRRRRRCARLTHWAATASPGATALPPELDAPLAAPEREALAPAGARVRWQGSLGASRRGYALLLVEARYLAARRSLARDRLVVLDAFAGNEVPNPHADEVSDEVRAKRRAQAGELLRRARELVLAGGAPDEENLNLLEEAAAVAARSGRADAAGPLAEYGMRKLPALRRSVRVPLPGGDPSAGLALARTRLAEQDARLEARWGYDLTRHNCITELARTTAGAFGCSGTGSANARRGAGGRRAVRLGPVRVLRPGPRPAAGRAGRRAARPPGPGARASPARVTGRSDRGPRVHRPDRTIYTPLLRDGAFLLFTDDVSGLTGVRRGEPGLRGWLLALRSRRRAVRRRRAPPRRRERRHVERARARVRERAQGLVRLEGLRAPSGPRGGVSRAARRRG